MKKFFVKIGCLVVAACVLMSVPVAGLEAETLITEESFSRPMGGIRCVPMDMPPQEIEPAADLHLYGLNQSFEEALVTAMENNQDTIDIRRFNMTEDEFISQYYDFCMLHPEFLLDTTWRWQIVGGKVLAMQPIFLFDDSVRAEKRRILEAAISSYVKAMSEKYQDPLEQLLYLHDSLAVNCVYDTEVVKKPVNQLTAEEALSFHAYGFIFNDLAVCQGYAQVFYAICKGLGYEVSYCRNNGHVWNYIKLDGAWYHMDVTWDDPTPDQPNTAIHKYFLCSDAVMQDHSPSQWVTPLEEMPVCSSTKYESGYMFNLLARKSIVKKDGYYQFNFSGRTFVSDRLWTGKVLSTKPKDGSVYYIYQEEPTDPVCIYTSYKDKKGVLRMGKTSLRSGEVMERNGTLVLYHYSLPTAANDIVSSNLFYWDAKTQKPAGPALAF